MFCMVPIQNNVSENWVEYLGRQFLGTWSSPTEVCVCVYVCVCGGGRIGGPDDLSDANTNFEKF